MKKNTLKKSKDLSCKQCCDVNKITVAGLVTSLLITLLQQ